jgi:phosphatidylglycerol:prolipoprotein diacylglycerol transferase
MIPAIEVYTWRVGPIAFHAFGFLVTLGIFVGYMAGRRRAPMFGVERADLASFLRWMLVTAFIMAHVLDEIFYHPEALVQPWTLLFIWDGLSSYGGFIGTCIGGVLWAYLETTPGAPFIRMRKTRRPLLAISDLIASIFPLAWTFGRMGCAVVHDHVGAPTTSALGVQFGFGPVDDYGLFGLHHGIDRRWDLGLLEMLFMIVASIGFAFMWRKKRPLGSYLVALCLVYPPVRFALDFLRVGPDEGGDARYLHLTPAQWACFAFFIVGVVLLRSLMSSAAAAPVTAAADAKPSASSAEAKPADPSPPGEVS